MLKSYTFIVTFLLTALGYSQSITQSISGKIVDSDTQQPLPYATVFVLNSNPLLGATSDENGKFTINKVPLGRVNVMVKSTGYQSEIIKDLVLSSAQSPFLEINLSSAFQELKEVQIKPGLKKQKPLNKMAMVSAKMLSVEEASRYAGGFDDPARLASVFPGVSGGSGGDNAISVRGNAPKYLQWKIEGIEIPNPNHFANLSSFGGGGLSALSSKVLDNSDFLTGAFPAEYANALAAVFDLKLREGSNSKNKHSVEIGAIGSDFASEGPIKKGHNASYLFNYRYSTLALVSPLLPEEARQVKYQDLSFKLHFPTTNAGDFSLWGIGLVDNSGADPVADSSKQRYYQDLEKQRVKQFLGVLGLGHKITVKNKGYVKTDIAYSGEGLDLFTDRMQAKESLVPQNSINNFNQNITFKSFYNQRISSNWINRTGVCFRLLSYNLRLRENLGQAKLEPLVDEKGSSSLVSGYTNFLYINGLWKFNFGLNVQVFTLNNAFTLEPRIAATRTLNESTTFSFAYGLHSRLEPLHTYFAVGSMGQLLNQDLSFTKAHHFVWSLEKELGANKHLKIEPYFQYLYHVPQAQNPNISLLNSQLNWFDTTAYSNKGLGRNYGLDLSYEQFLQQGFYYLISASIFQSQFKGSNNTWYNTRFNKTYVVNMLVGKELELGKNKANVLSINLRLVLQGGDRHHRVDVASSQVEKEVVYDLSQPFSNQMGGSLVMHSTVSYSWNKPKSTHQLALKVLNANSYKEFYGHRYNLASNQVEENREALMIPNLSYRYSF